jgi:Leucine Rich repeat
MILVLIVGGVLGWKARRASLQRRAVARIECLRGEVGYDWQPRSSFPGAAPVGAQPPGPAWLRRMLGDEYFQEVVEVTLPGLQMPSISIPSPDAPREGPEWQAFSDHVRRDKEAKEALDGDELACLEGLDQIESLTLWGPALKSEGLARLGRSTSLKNLTSLSNPMTAEGVAQIARLSKLERLAIKLNLPDDAPLAALGRLPGLKDLSIYDGSKDDGSIPKFHPGGSAKTPGKFTDSWLARLGRLNSLTRLYLDDSSRITDAGLAHLKGLGRLESLDLDGSPWITDVGLAQLEGLVSLKSLELSSATEIGDEGLAHLKDLDRLEHLFLSSTSRVTDAGIAHLEGLKNLEWIKLSSASRVTDAGVESLAKLPALRGLDLNAKSLTDAGLIRLGALKNLKVLTLTGAKIDGEILDGIQAAIPGLSIEAERIGEGGEAVSQSTNPGVSSTPPDPFEPK